MDPKPRPQHEAYLQILRGMQPQERLRKAFELSDFSKSLFKQGLRLRFPALGDVEFHRLYLERLGKCHNSNY